MKNLRIVLAAIVVFVLVGCQSDKHVRATVNPGRPVVACSKMYYKFDENFLTYFGPEGITALEGALQEAHAHDYIRIDFSESDE